MKDFIAPLVLGIFTIGVNYTVWHLRREEGAHLAVLEGITVAEICGHRVDDDQRGTRLLNDLIKPRQIADEVERTLAVQITDGAERVYPRQVCSERV